MFSHLLRERPNWGRRTAHKKEALANSPGPKTRVAFRKEIFEEGSLTIANVRGRLKMNTFRDFRNFFLVLARWPRAFERAARPAVACRAFSLRPARPPVANAGIKYLDRYL